MLTAFLMAAILGAAQAGRQLNTTNNSERVIINGETDITIADDGAGGGDNRCTAGSTLKGIANTVTESMGSKPIGLNFSTATLGLVAGTYDVLCKTAGTGATTTVNRGVSIVEPVYSVTLFADEPGKYREEIKTVASGGSLQVNASNTINDVIAGCRVTVKVRQKGTSANKLSGISPWSSNATDLGESDEAPGTGRLELTPTSNWPPSDYEFILDPSASSCNGIDADSPVLKTLKVVPAGLTLSADKSKPGIDEVVTLTCSTSPFQPLSLFITRGDAKKVEVVTFDADSVKMRTAAGTLVSPNATDTPQNYGFANGSADSAAYTFNSKSGGNCIVQVRFRKEGNYDLKVSGTVEGANVSQTLNFNVQSLLTSVRTDQSTYILGDDVEIKGSSSAGDRIAIAINDKIYWNDVSRLADGTYSQTWSGRVETAPRKSTSNFTAGPVTIKVWVCPGTVALNEAGTACDIALGKEVKSGICDKGAETDQSNCNAKGGKLKGPDATVSLSLRDQSVTLTSPTPGQQVAEDDSFSVKGDAPGADKVFIWVFNAKGTTSGGVCRSEAQSVSAPNQGYQFSKSFGAEVTDKAGEFTVVVQSLGRDGVYSDGKQGTGPANDPTAAGNFPCSDDATAGILANRVGSQILSILQDAALTKAGSDDQGVFKVVQFKVVAPSVKLDACPATVKATDLRVNGTSNRKEGTSILVKATGPKELSPKTTTVTKNGTFSAVFPASEIGDDVGTYTITADDLKGQTDTATCSIVTGTSCTLSVTLASDKTQIEKDERARLTATLTNPSDEACTGTALTSTVDPATGAVVTWDSTSVDVPAKGSTTVNGEISATVDGSYRVALEARRGTANASGTVTIAVGKATAATPQPTATPAQTPVSTGAPGGVLSPFPTTKPSPGFEAVFALAGLLAIAHLTRRRGK